MEQEFEGFKTLAINTAKELGIDLLRNIPVNTRLYDKWGLDTGFGIVEDGLPIEIIYFAQSGQMFKETVTGQHYPWPLSDDDKEKFREQVRNALKAIQSAVEAGSKSST